MIDTILIGRPSVVTSNWKSTAHTRLGASAIAGCGAGVVVGGPEPSARMVLRVGTQPVPQRGVRIGWCCCGGFVALGGTVLPGDAAGEPFTDPQHTLEMTNGSPPAFRA